MEINYNELLMNPNRTIYQNRCVGLSAARNNEVGSESIKRNLIPPKHETGAIVFDDGLLNAGTDVSNYHFPILQVQILIPENYSKVSSLVGFSVFYHNVSFTPQRQSLTTFC